MNEASKSVWPGPKGLIPVTSGKEEDANVYNRAYLDNIHVEMRVIDSTEPELGTEIFGERFSSPIMMPAFSHLNKVGEDGKRPMVQYALAAKELQLMNWVGMEEDADYAEIAATGARTVRIIKPFRDHAVILEQIDFAARHKAIAVGIDIDHIPGKDGKYDIVDGIPMGPVTSEDLRAYIAASPVPFVAKGVLSVQDALKAKEAGCAAIVVSHHHSRIPFGIAPLQVLPRIREALAGERRQDFCRLFHGQWLRRVQGTGPRRGCRLRGARHTFAASQRRNGGRQEKDIEDERRTRGTYDVYGRSEYRGV